MPEVFAGTWTVEVKSTDTGFDARYLINGSATADGAYPGVVEGPRVVDGQEWSITIQWSNPASPGWFESDVRRIPRFVVGEGLIVELQADDNTHDPHRDRDFNDIVLTCRSQDPALNPTEDQTNPFDFTLVDGQFVLDDTKPD